MIYIIYILVFLILVIVVFIGTKAALRGINAKNSNYSNYQKEEDSQLESQQNEFSSKIITEMERLKKLYEGGVLTKEEFKKAKEKILNS